MPSYAVIKLKLRAEIGHWIFHDVVQFVSGFAMNSIPMASLLVAVGRNVDTDEIATIHKAIKDLKVQVPAKVFLTADVRDVEDAEPGLPDEQEFLIFEGKAVGIGWRRTQSGANFTIHLLHWLGDINYSSAISASSHPGNPSDWTYPSLYKALALGSAASAGGSKPGDPSWVPMINRGSIDTNTLADIWGLAIHRWMLDVASDEPFDNSLLGGQPGGGNANTIAALNRIGPNPDGAPLDVELGGADAEVIAEGLRQALENENGSSWINTTLWGKLVGDWAPAYWFSVIPRIEDALIVPFTGGLRGEPWAVLGDEDYDLVEINSQLWQVLRAVGIIHPVLWATGADMNLGAIGASRSGACGWYQPPTVEQGMVLLKDAPKWLSDPLLAYSFTLDSEAINAGDVVNNSLDEENTGKTRIPARDLTGIQRQNKSIMDNYAHQWYVLESLKGRVGELAGKLRFDISPGSNVLIKAAGARNIPEEDDLLKEDVYATVLQVSYLINAETQRAATAFMLAHVRTELENNDDATSVIKPPLYKEAWRGAVLSKAVQPEKS